MLLSLESVKPVEKNDEGFYCAYAFEYIIEGEVDILGLLGHIIEKGDDVLMYLVGWQFFHFPFLLRINYVL